MKRHWVMGVLASAMLIWVFAARAQAAEVHINVNIGGPPPVILHSAPTMVYLPEPALYVAVGIPYDMYFYGGRYYHVRGNNWYWAPGYGGPWNTVVYTSLPPGLRKYKAARLHEFRDREYRVYRVSSRDYRDRRDRYFVADYGPGKSQGNGRGRGHGTGKRR
jgi:hypothetical protein